MNKIFCAITVILIVLIVSTPGFSLNDSKIVGMVVDKKTGTPIQGASLTLFFRIQLDSNFNREEIKTTQTDLNGKFSFEAPWSGFYFIKCQKETYVPFLPQYYYKYVKDELISKKAGVFRVGEGEIKHLRIELEKGGILKGVFKIKETGKTAPQQFSAFIYKKSPFDESFVSENDYSIASVYSDDKGYFELANLETGDDYYLRIILGDGYPYQRIRNIRVSKGNITDISTTFDFTSTAGLKGNIVIKGNPPNTGWLDLASNFKDQFGYTVISRYILEDNTGNYCFKALQPGKYYLQVSCFDQDGEQFSREFEVQVTEGIQKQLNISDQ
jgi:hypothetical protein